MWHLQGESCLKWHRDVIFSWKKVSKWPTPEVDKNTKMLLLNSYFTNAIWTTMPCLDSWGCIERILIRIFFFFTWLPPWMNWIVMCFTVIKLAYIIGKCIHLFISNYCMWTWTLRDSTERWIDWIVLSSIWSESIWFHACNQIWAPSRRLQEDLRDMRGACRASSSNSHRFLFALLSNFFLFFNIPYYKDKALCCLNVLCFCFFLHQEGFLPFWGEVFCVWVRVFLKWGTSHSITSLTDRHSCTSLTLRTDKSPTFASKMPWKMIVCWIKTQLSCQCAAVIFKRHDMTVADKYWMYFWELECLWERCWRCFCPLQICQNRRLCSGHHGEACGHHRIWHVCLSRPLQKYLLQVWRRHFLLSPTAVLRQSPEAKSLSYFTDYFLSKVT